MMAQESGLRCEVCGAGGTLVQFGDARRYHYHCLSCWRQVAEQVAVAYAERDQT
jgi:DNA-directed RNA polymerase subunit RPC12/RpoP